MQLKRYLIRLLPHEMVLKILDISIKVLLLLSAAVTAACLVPSRYLLAIGLTLPLLAGGLKLAVRTGILVEDRAYKLAAKGLRLAAQVFMAPIILMVIALAFPVAYAMVLASVLWSVSASTPLVVVVCLLKTAYVFLIYWVPDALYARAVCDRRVAEWVDHRIDQRDGAISDPEILQLVLDASLLFAPRLSDAPPLTEKVARHVARRRKRKLHIIRRFPAWWELFRYVLPENIETQVFDPTYNNLLADYLTADQHFKDPSRRKWLTFCFGLRTILMFLECLRVYITDRTVGSLVRLGPRYIKALWRSFFAE